MARFRSLGVVLAAVVLGIAPAAARGQESGEKTALSTIRVGGEATLAAKPDQAEINLGVVTQAATAQAAAAQNAQKQDAVLGELRKALGAGAEIKTIGYSLSPNYRYPKEGGQPAITGYTASNVVHVTVPDLGQVGRILDLATQSGANSVDALRFSLKDEDGVRQQALRAAAIQARAKADALASALKLRIVRVLQVEEGGQPVRPVMMEAATLRAGAPAPTPVEPGNIQVQASVTLTVEVAP